MISVKTVKDSCMTNSRTCSFAYITPQLHNVSPSHFQKIHPSVQSSFKTHLMLILPSKLSEISAPTNQLQQFIMSCFPSNCPRVSYCTQLPSTGDACLLCYLQEESGSAANRTKLDSECIKLTIEDRKGHSSFKKLI